MPCGKKTNKQVCHKEVMINQLEAELAECRLALENEKAKSEVNVEKIAEGFEKRTREILVAVNEMAAEQRINMEKMKVEHDKLDCQERSLAIKRLKFLLKLNEDELSDADKKILLQEEKIVKLHQQLKSFTIESEINKKRSNKEMFPCEICLRPYSPELKMSPRVLDCGHTLCFSCVERLINEEGTIKCPFDRTPTELGDVDIERGLPRNYAVLNMCS